MILLNPHPRRPPVNRKRSITRKYKTVSLLPSLVDCASLGHVLGAVDHMREGKRQGRQTFGGA
jgi:hypothetical protein